MLPSHVPAYSVGPFVGLVVNAMLCLLCLAFWLFNRRYRPQAALGWFYFTVTIFFLGFTGYAFQSSSASIVFWYRILLIGGIWAPIAWIRFMSLMGPVGGDAVFRAAAAAGALLTILVVVVNHPAVVSLPLEPVPAQGGVWRPQSWLVRPLIGLTNLAVLVVYLYLILFRWWRGLRRPAFVYAITLGLVMWLLCAVNDAILSWRLTAPVPTNILWLGSVGASLTQVVAVALHFRGIEEALGESEGRYRAVIEANPDPVVLYDMAGRVEYLNPAFEGVFGWSLADYRGRKLDHFVPEENWPETRRMIDRGVEGEVFSGVETRRYARDGRVIPVLISGSIHRDSGGRPRGSVVTLRDITAQKRLEEELRQAQKMEAVGRLAGGVAHDFNNILQVVSGYVQLMLSHPDQSAVNQDRLAAVDRSVERAAELVRRLLTFSRKVESKLGPLDLNQEVFQTAEMLERTIPKMIRVELDLAEDLWTVNGDPSQIEQVLMNLATNARDAMPQGGRLTVETRNIVIEERQCRANPELSPGRHVLLRVSDTGHGIAPEYMARIFEPFFTTKPIGEGTGLGLSIIYGIVRGHGGHVFCDSHPGQGTTFNIYLPALETHAPPRADGEAPSSEAVAGGRETVLLVDDEAEILDIAAAALQHHGYSTLSARSGEEAIDTFRRDGGRVDLVVLDLNMPGMGGAECLRRLRRIDPGIKVIVASGYAAGNPEKAVGDAGGAEFMAKPYRLETLLQRVRSQLEA